MIILRALGSAEIETGITTVAPSQEIVFAAALYLVLERGKRVSRDRLSSLLWPRVPEKARAHRMRQTILQLKKVGIIVKADRNTIQLSQHDARSDVDDLSSADSAPVLKHDSLEFLPGYDPRLSEAFGEWVESKREEAHARATRILVHDLGQSRLQADWSSVEKIAAKCLSLDGYNEVAVLAQAEAAAMRGGKRKAVSILDRYIADVGEGQSDLKLPATLLRRRVVERVPDRPALLNSDPPFVGREKEMEALTRSFDRARNANGSAALVVGEPGIGKSRLCAELARFAELQGAQVQRATCRRTDLDRPLSLFVDIVPQLREMPGALGCAPETFAWLKRLTEFEQRSEHNSHALDAAMLFENVRASLFDLLDSVAEERCLVILIEDVQWLDDASAKILGRMIDWCQAKRLFFLLNSRPTDNSGLDYGEKARINTIPLGPLTSVASTALLRSVALRRSNEPECGFADWCVVVAEGNPFFLQELAHQWIETGRRYEAPPSVTKVLQERLSRLGPQALQILQACTVLGDHATVDRVEKLLKYHPHQLLGAVEELSKAAMLAPPGEQDCAGAQLQPRHDFLASAAISRLAPISLAFLHRRSADVLETEIAQEKMPATLLWACANHRHRAGDKKRALSLRLSCAQHLLEIGLADEACRRYEDSLGYCTSDEDRLAVLLPLSVALPLNGEWERTKEVLRTCIRIRSNGETPEPHCEFEVMLFQARYRSTLEFVDLLNDILPCVKSHNASPQHRVSAAVVALKVASDVGPSAILDTIYSEIEPFLHMKHLDPVGRLEAEIIYQTMRGRRELQIELLEEFALAARSLHGEIAYSHALTFCSSSCRIAANDERAARFIQSAFDHAIAHKLAARLTLINLSAIRLHVAAEDWVAARKALCAQQQYSLPEDDKNTRAELAFCEVRVSLAEGDLVAAETALARLEVVPQSYSVNRNAICLALVLRLQLASRRGLESIGPLVRNLEAAHRINRDIGNQDFESHALFLGLSALGQERRGLDLLLAYVQTHRTTRRPLSRDIQEILNQHGGRGGLVRSRRLKGRGAAV